MIGELLGEMIGAVFEVAGYLVGRLVVPVVSLGYIRCDRMMVRTGRRGRRRWGELFHRHNGRVHLSAEATALVGLVFIVLMVAGGFWVYQLRG